MNSKQKDHFILWSSGEKNHLKHQSFLFSEPFQTNIVKNIFNLKKVKFIVYNLKKKNKCKFNFIF